MAQQSAEPEIYLDEQGEPIYMDEQGNPIKKTAPAEKSWWELANTKFFGDAPERFAASVRDYLTPTGATHPHAKFPGQVAEFLIGGLIPNSAVDVGLMGATGALGKYGVPAAKGAYRAIRGGAKAAKAAEVLPVKPSGLAQIADNITAPTPPVMGPPAPTAVLKPAAPLPVTPSAEDAARLTAQGYNPAAIKIKPKAPAPVAQAAEEAPLLVQLSRDDVETVLQTNVLEAMKKGWITKVGDDLFELTPGKLRQMRGQKGAPPVPAPVAGALTPAQQELANRPLQIFDEFTQKLDDINRPPDTTLGQLPPPAAPPRPPVSTGPPGPIPDPLGGGKTGPLTDVRASIPAELWNLARGTLTAGDLTSAAFRQARPMMLNKAWWTSWNNAIRSFGSEKAYQLARATLHADPLMQKTIPVLSKKTGKPKIDKFTKQPKMTSEVEESGLYISDLLDFTKREEAIMSTWAEKFPLVRRSNRAYTSFLNEVRLGSWKAMIKSAEKMGMDPMNNKEMLKDFAKLVNNLTGRGSLAVTVPKKLPFKMGNVPEFFNPGKEYSAEKYGALANTWIFSPRLMSAQVRNYEKWFNPFSYVNENPVVRRQKLKGLLATAGFWGTLGTLGEMTGLGEVDLNPISTDFGKVRIGNLRLDIGGGMQQYLVAAARIALQQTETSRGETKDFGEGFDYANTGKVVGNLMANKLHPTARFAYDLATASNYQGTGKYGSIDLFNPNPLDNHLANVYTPMVVQDLWEIYKEDPSLLPMLTAPVVAGAIGTQRYGKGVQ